MNRAHRRIEQQIPRLRRYARALLGDRERADDLVQDTLERALSKWHLWRADSDVRAWLFTIMHNIYVNQVRRMQRDVVMPHRDDTPEIVQQPNHEQVLMLRDVMAALQRLPDEFRQVLLLVGLEQMSYAEAAKVLGVPQGTVMSRLARGRERLRALTATDTIPPLRRVK